MSHSDRPMPPASMNQEAGVLPVLLVAFNRLGPTRRVLAAIREYRPSRFYVAADGPRPGVAGEETTTSAVRTFILDNIDWPCEVQTLFRTENLGVKKAVGGAIDWFFEHEESGVILEDDCLPDQSFFPYCEELLERYRDDERVMHIGGDCYLKDRPEDQSYFFSKYPHIWGWATWRDSWSRFSTTSEDFEREFAAISDIYSSPEEREHWYRLYRDYFDGAYDSWAYGWTFTVWRNRGLAIYPMRNLVKNIGFGYDAVHTKAWRDYKGLRKAPLESTGELVHPARVELDHDLDRQNFRIFFQRPGRIVLAWKVLGSIASVAFERLREALGRASSRDA